MFRITSDGRFANLISTQFAEQETFWGAYEVVQIVRKQLATLATLPPLAFDDRLNDVAGTYCLTGYDRYTQREVGKFEIRRDK